MIVMKNATNSYLKYVKQNVKPNILFAKKMEKIPKDTCMITCTKRQLATLQPLHILNTFVEMSILIHYTVHCTAGFFLTK